MQCSSVWCNWHFWPGVVDTCVLHRPCASTHSLILVIAQLCTGQSAVCQTSSTKPLYRYEACQSLNKSCVLASIAALHRLWFSLRCHAVLHLVWSCCTLCNRQMHTPYASKHAHTAWPTTNSRLAVKLRPGKGMRERVCARWDCRCCHRC